MSRGDATTRSEVDCFDSLENTTSDIGSRTGSAKFDSSISILAHVYILH